MEGVEGPAVREGTEVQSHHLGMSTDDLASSVAGMQLAGESKNSPGYEDDFEEDHEEGTGDQAAYDVMLEEGGSKEGGGKR